MQKKIRLLITFFLWMPLCFSQIQHKRTDATVQSFENQIEARILKLTHREEQLSDLQFIYTPESLTSTEKITALKNLLKGVYLLIDVPREIRNLKFIEITNQTSKLSLVELPQSPDLKLVVPLTITSANYLGKELNATSAADFLPFLAQDQLPQLRDLFSAVSNKLHQLDDNKKRLKRAQEEAQSNKKEENKVPRQMNQASVAGTLQYHPNRIIVWGTEQQVRQHPSVIAVRAANSPREIQPEDAATQAKIAALKPEYRPRKMDPTWSREERLKAMDRDMDPRRREKWLSLRQAKEDKLHEFAEKRQMQHIVTLQNGVSPTEVVAALKEAGVEAELDYLATVESSDAIKNIRQKMKSRVVPAVKYTKKDILNLSSKDGGGFPFFPSDGLIGEQWYLNANPGINAFNAWSFWGSQFFSSPVVVAVIDSGIEHSNPDFADSLGLTTVILDGYDFYENNFIPEDEYGHGTNVAGVFGAVADNDFFCSITLNISGCTIAGIASHQNTYIMPLRSFGPAGTGYVSDIIDAVYYAVNNGASIINTSFRVQGFSTALKNALAFADAQGVIVVASAGNQSANSDNAYTQHYPSGYNLPNIVSVGAINPSGSIRSTSNVGICTVDFFAPGGDIFTTSLGASFETYPWHDFVSGTSFSAAATTGVLASLLVRFPGMTVDEYMFALRGGVVPAGNLSGYALTGGRLDMDLAMSVAEEVFNFTLIPFPLGPAHCPNGNYNDAPPPPAPNRSSGGGCFIATAAYGTPLHTDIFWLRKFRDQVLLPTSVGKELVSFYYEHSPQFAAKLEQSPIAKRVVRAILAPLVWTVQWLVD